MADHLTTLTVGIVGAGQLARMMVQAAIPLGITVRLLAARADDGAALVAPNVAVGPPDSLDALRGLAAACDVVTFDHELVDVAQLRALEAEGRCLRPSAATVAIAQDKGRQRTMFREAGLPVPPFRLVRDAGDIAAFGSTHGWPVVAKACRGGYDGRGVWVLGGPTEAAGLAARAAEAGTELLVETWVPIEREIAVLVARRPGGEAVVYPVAETVQRDGICHEVLAPAPIPPALAEEAARIALRIAAVVDVTGILAVEMFVTDGALVLNEIATRPHNSGHYSIEGCGTSQFENHLRAVRDWPLGTTDLMAPAVATANVLAGPHTRDLAAGLPAALAVAGAHVHLYGKEPRPGRKVGHVTALGDDIAEARARAVRAAGYLRGDQAHHEDPKAQRAK